MKLSLCNEVVRELDFREQCALARDLGYDGLELAPFTLSDEPHRLSAARRAELRRIAEDAGTPVTGLHWLLLVPDGLSITSAEAAVRARTVDVMRGLIELCADLGGRVLVHGSPKQRALGPGESAEIAIARAGDAFARIAEDAEQADVLYCIEPLAHAETAVINTVEEAATVVEAVASPAVRTMIDTCAASQAEDATIPDLIDRRLPGGLIGHVHLNDTSRRAPGQGKLRFAPILQALERNRYAGICSVEPFVYEPDGPTTAARAIGYLRGLAEALDDPPDATG